MRNCGSQSRRGLVAWIEPRLNEHGVAKLVPDETVLVDAYKRISREAVVQKEIDRVLAVMKPEADATPPDNLHERVKDMLNGPYREESWDSALRRIVKDGLQS